MSREEEKQRGCEQPGVGLCKCELGSSKGVFPRITIVPSPVQEFKFDPKVERITAILLCLRSAFGIPSFVLPLESSSLHSPITAALGHAGFSESEFLSLCSCTTRVHFYERLSPERRFAGGTNSSSFSESNTEFAIGTTP